MEKLVKGIQRCCCGRDYEWQFLIKENGSYYFGNPFEWTQNVLNYSDMGNSYAVTTQCPHCNRRTSITQVK